MLAQRSRLVITRLLGVKRLLILLLRLLLLLLLWLLHHGSTLLRLGFHLKVVAARGSTPDGEAALLAAAQEHDKSIDKSGDEEKPNQGANTRNGTKHGLAALEQVRPLLKLSLPVAKLAVDGTAVVNASAHGRRDTKRGSTSGTGSKGGKPHDDEESLEDNNGNDMVCLVPAGDFFGEEDVEEDDPGDDGSRNSQAKLIEIQIVHQTTCQCQNDQRKKELEPSDNGHPDGCLEHMARGVLCRDGSLHDG